MLKIFALVISLITFLLPSHAQENPQTDGAENTEEKRPSVVELVAPYDDKLLRLAEVLGSIHYLRALCGANEGNKWRDRMSELIATENPAPKRRARLVASFNRGYRAFNTTYSDCTQSALHAANRYQKEGVLLTSQITGRYGR